MLIENVNGKSEMLFEHVSGLLYESDRRLRGLASSENPITNNGIELGSGTATPLERASI